MVASSLAREAAIQAVRGVTLTEEDAKIIMEYVTGAVHPQFYNALDAVRAQQPDMNQVNRTVGSNAPMGIGEPQDVMKVGPYLTGSPKQVRYTRAEVFESNAAHDTKAVQRNLSAAQFLRAHPEFETFLDLIKDGAITLY